MPDPRPTEYTVKVRLPDDMLDRANRLRELATDRRQRAQTCVRVLSKHFLAMADNYDAQADAIMSVMKEGTGTDETRVSSFPTDIEAVRFMERAVRQGATVVECVAPDA